MSVQNSQGSGGLRLRKQSKQEVGNSPICSCKGSGKFNFGYQLNVKIHDIDFEPGVLDDKDKEEVGFYTYRNMKFIDCADLESPHTIMVPLRNSKPEEVVRIIVQNLEDEEFFGSISVPLKKYFLNDTIVKNHEYTQWMTLFDDPEDDEFDGELEDDDPDHPKILVSFAITEVAFGPGGQVVQQEVAAASIKTGEVDHSSVLSPPRDVDMTSQIEEGEHVTVNIDKHKGMSTKSVEQEVHEPPAEEYKELRSYSQSQIQQQFVSTTNVTTHHQVSNQYETFKLGVEDVDRETIEVNSLKRDNYMEFSQTETRGLTSQRQISTGKQLSPGEFKQTDVTHITSGVESSPNVKQQLQTSSKHFANASEEFRTKSGIKTTAAFEQAEQIVVSSIQDQQQVVEEPKKQQYEFHPPAEAEPDESKASAHSDDDDMQETQNVPSASQPPSLPAMDSEQSAKMQKNPEREQLPRAAQFSELESALDVQQQVSIDTAAEAAKNRRSVTTGMLRMQPQGAIDPEHLSFLFGGSAKPKLATEKVNILKEKEKAMAWIKDEQKKYDLEVLMQDLTSQIQTTVYNIKKEQKDIVNDEKRQVARLDKVDQFHSDLGLTKSEVDNKNVKIDEISKKAHLSFQQFDEARATNKAYLETELAKKRKEMQDVKNEEAAQNAENNRQKAKIKNQREQRKAEGVRADKDCIMTMQEESNLEVQLDAARKKNLEDVQKTKQLRTEFSKLKSNYNSEIEDLRRKLNAENQRRESSQSDALTTERELILAQSSNFELKAEVYQKEIDRTKLENKKEQAERNIKLLSEKKRQLDQQLQSAQSAEEAQTRRIESDLQKVTNELAISKSECENAELKLSDLQAKNETVDSENWENKLRALQEKFDLQERQREEAQAVADKAMAEMGSKLNVFKDPYLDRASETDDLMAKIKQLGSGDVGLNGADSSTGLDSHSGPGSLRADGAASLGSGGRSARGLGGDSISGLGGDNASGLDGRSARGLGRDGASGLASHQETLNDLMNLNNDLKAKTDRLNDLKKRRDNLDSRRQKKQGIEELQSSLRKACAEYDKMADDLERQVSDIDSITQKVNQATEDRRSALDEQIGQNGQLSRLRHEKLSQERERIKLDKEIQNLSRASERYKQEIRNMQDEKDVLVENVDQLDQLVQAREADLAQIEADLDVCNQQIDFLHERIIQQGKNKKPAKLFTGKKGDMLDELLGNYINETGCPVPIQRLGNGFYMFGTRKIFAKVLNGRLVIRVGGGFMVIEEFIQAHAEQEMRKKRHKEEQEAQAAANAAMGGNSPRKKDGKMIQAVSDTKLSGTVRTKRFTEAQLKNLQARGGVRVVSPRQSH